MNEFELDKLVKRLEARAESRNWKNWLQLFNGVMMFLLAGNLLDDVVRLDSGLGVRLLISFTLAVGALSICTAVVEFRSSITDKLLLHLLKLQPDRKSTR